jgi:U3 small nucleolar RNA-associated protein 7
MVSAGADYRVKIWDVRNYREIHSYYTQRPTDQVTISDTGLLGIGWGGHVSVVLFTLRSNSRYGKMHFE